MSEAQELNGNSHLLPASASASTPAELTANTDGAEDWGGAGDLAAPPSEEEVSKRRAAELTARGGEGVLGVIGWEVRADASVVGAELMRLMDSGESMDYQPGLQEKLLTLLKPHQQARGSALAASRLGGAASAPRFGDVGEGGAEGEKGGAGSRSGVCVCV